VKSTKAGMFGGMKLRVVSLFKMAHNMRLGVGYKLDELQIDATINSVDDIDLLIKRLEFLRPCFMNGFSGTPKQIDKL